MAFIFMEHFMIHNITSLQLSAVNCKAESKPYFILVREVLEGKEKNIMIYFFLLAIQNQND